MVEIEVWVASFVAGRREGQVFSIKQYRQRQQTAVQYYETLTVPHPSRPDTLHQVFMELRGLLFSQLSSHLPEALESASRSSWGLMLKPVSNIFPIHSTTH